MTDETLNMDISKTELFHKIQQTFDKNVLKNWYLSDVGFLEDGEIRLVLSRRSVPLNMLQVSKMYAFNK